MNNSNKDDKDDDEQQKINNLWKNRSRVLSYIYSQQHRGQKRSIWWNSDPNKSQQGVPQAVAAWT